MQTTRVIVAALLGVFAVSAVGCVFRRVEVQAVKPSDQISIVGPAKAHLKDGSTVVYAQSVSVTVRDQTLRGTGVRYNHTLTEATPVESVPLEMVVGMETFETKVNLLPTLVASFAAVEGALLGVVVAIYALLALGGPA